MGQGGGGEPSTSGGAPWMDRPAKLEIISRSDGGFAGGSEDEWWAGFGTVGDALEGLGWEGAGLGTMAWGKCFFLYWRSTRWSICGSCELRVTNKEVGRAYSVCLSVQTQTISEVAGRLSLYGLLKMLQGRHRLGLPRPTLFSAGGWCRRGCRHRLVKRPGHMFILVIVPSGLFVCSYWRLGLGCFSRLRRF